jgi:hypothetical protein
MTAAEAARLLDLPPDATSEQLETRFLDRRRKLEDKIAKAPTPGLQAKYRASLADITRAFEHLTLAADSSHLPILQRAAEGQGGLVASSQANRAKGGEASTAAASGTKPRHGKNEFLIVLIVAVLLTGGGGWWIVKVREEAAERARIEAEARALAQAEAERLAKLASQLGAQLAEAKVEWEAYESNLADAERRVAELKSDARDQAQYDAARRAEHSALLASQLYYSEWLKNYLLRHPAKIARARAEQLLSARSVDDAKAAADELTTALADISQAMEVRRKYLFKTTGTLRIESEPAGLSWVLVDAYGREARGVTPGDVTGLPLTHVIREGAANTDSPDAMQKLGELTRDNVTVTLSRPGWEDAKLEAPLADGEQKVLRFAPYQEGAFTVVSKPSGVPWEASNQLGWKVSGVAPAEVRPVPPGSVTVIASRKGYAPVTETFTIAPNATHALTVDQLGHTMDIAVEEKEAEIWVSGRLAGRGTVTLKDLALGEFSIELRLAGNKAFKPRLAVKAGEKTSTHRFSFRELNIQKHPCAACDSRGSFVRSRSCNGCDGSGKEECSNCNGSGTVLNAMAVFANSLAKELNNTSHVRQEEYSNCGTCRGRRTVTCQSSGCDRGTYRWNENCVTCGGDGLRSFMDMSS